MVSDLIIIAVAVLFVIIGYHRGFARTLFNLIGTFAAAVFARVLSLQLSGWFYDAFIREGVINSLEERISAGGGEVTVTNGLNSAPDWIKGMTALLWEDGKSDSALQSVFPSARSLAVSIESAVRDIAVTVLSLLASVVLFVILMVFVKLAVRGLCKLFEAPVLKQINRVFGAVFGALEGFLVVLLAINIFYVIISINNPGLLKEEIWIGVIFKTLCVIKL